METTWTRCSMCMNVDGFLRNNKFPRGYDIFQQDDGTPLTPEEALAYLHTEKAKGHEVIPCGEACGNPCKNADKGCTGFDYSGGGCPGYKVPNVVRVERHPRQTACAYDRRAAKSVTEI